MQPIGIERLAPLFKRGITQEQITEEIIWLGWQGIRLDSLKGREQYIRLSRVGRTFAMNRETRHALCDYVERVNDVIATNIECFEYIREEQKVS